MIPKIGITKRGHKLACFPQHDSRSAAFPICGAAPLPSTPITKHWNDHIPALDQGQVGSCVGNGFAHDIAADPDPVQNVDECLAVTIYKLAQSLDGNPDPHEGSSVLAGAKASAQLDYIVEYRWAYTLKDIAQALSYLGPVVIGVAWYTGMDDVDVQGFVHPTGEIMGGHCVCIVGIDVPAAGNENNATYTIKNSWGPSWGFNGHCKISAADLAFLLAQPGSAFCVPLTKALGKAPLPPVPWWKRFFNQFLG